jgi:hypothetical protein
MIYSSVLQFKLEVKRRATGRMERRRIFAFREKGTDRDTELNDENRQRAVKNVLRWNELVAIKVARIAKIVSRSSDGVAN